MPSKLPQDPFRRPPEKSGVALPLLILLLMMVVAASFSYRFSIGTSGVVFEKDSSNVRIQP